MRGGLGVGCGLIVVLVAGCASAPPETLGGTAIREEYTYSRETVLREAEYFFGVGAAGLGAIFERAFQSFGRPTGFITGEEAAAALSLGVRYGHGTLRLRGGQEAPVYWQGPSIGFDFGGNASKVFVLVYNLYDVDRVYRRYPGVDGSLYLVGGFGMNLHRRDEIVLAPIRLGVGWRQGANLGYLRVSSEFSPIPF